MTDFRVHPKVLIRARAALAEPEPEGREPASVVEEPSDKNCWQWYAYCPEEGLEMYSDREQAQSAAQSIMGSYEAVAHSDGWHEDMESVSWGMLVPVEQAQVVERKTAKPDDEFDEWVKYELRTARFGHQPAPPDEGEVAELERRFQVWWYNEGSGMPPVADEDQEAHVHRISQIAWHYGAYVARYSRPTPASVGEVEP